MDDGVQILGIAVFAAIACVLLFRLLGVLGRRTGNERSDPVTPWNWGARQRQNDASSPKPGPIIDVVAQPGASGDGKGIAAIQAADRKFDQRRFLDGARSAFQIIVNSFSVGDTAALRPLLSEDVYRSFTAAIEAHGHAKEKLETRLMSIKSAEITAAAVEGATALITVTIVSEQIHVLRGEDGTVLEGHPDQVDEKTDVWTFARSIRSRDPNWMLVATQSPA